MFDGKAFGLEIVEAVKGHMARTVEPLLARIDALEQQIKAMPVPRDGKDADPEVVRGMVAEAVAAIPVPRDGRDADPEAIREMVAAEVAKLPAPQDGKDTDPAVVAEMVAAEVAKIPPARDGKDADLAAVAEMVADEVARAVASLPPPPAGRSLEPADVAGMIVDEVSKAVDALPRPVDPVGVAGALIDRSGSLVLTLSDGSIKNLGPVVGKDIDPVAVATMVREEVGKIPAPRDGHDGFGFDDLTVEHDGERSVVLRFARGDETKEFALSLPVVLDRGVWRDGGEYEKGDAVSYGGSLWIAQQPTKGRPDGGDDGWRLAVKRGRDGKDGSTAAKAAPGPVRVSLPRPAGK